MYVGKYAIDWYKFGIMCLQQRQCRTSICLRVVEVFLTTLKGLSSKEAETDTQCGQSPGGD